MDERRPPTIADMLEEAKWAAGSMANILGGEPEEWLGECWMAVERCVGRSRGYLFTACLHACRRAKHLDSRVLKCGPKVKRSQQVREANEAERRRVTYAGRQEEQRQAHQELHEFLSEISPEVLAILRMLGEGATFWRIDFTIGSYRGWAEDRLERAEVSIECPVRLGYAFRDFDWKINNPCPQPESDFIPRDQGVIPEPRD